MSGPAEDEQYCTTCGEIVKKQAEICPECGTRRKPVPQSQSGTDTTTTSSTAKDPGLAAVLSFFYSGLGQIYNGQIAKGLLLIVVQFINILLVFVLIGLLTYPLVWIYGMYDAYTVAERKTAQASQ